MLLPSDINSLDCDINSKFCDINSGPRPLGAMRLDPAKASLCLPLLTEGCSIRSTERVSGVHRDTITRLLVLAGRNGGAA